MLVLYYFAKKLLTMIVNNILMLTKTWNLIYSAQWRFE